MCESWDEDERESEGEDGASKFGCLHFTVLIISLLSFGMMAGGMWMQGFTVNPGGIVLSVAGALIWIVTACLVASRKKLRRRSLPPNGTQLSAEVSAAVLEERVRVPSYEAVVGSGSSPAVVTSGGGNDTRISSDSQPPSYEDVLKMGPVSWVVVVGGVNATPDLSQPQHGAAAVPLEASVAL